MIQKISFKNKFDQLLSARIEKPAGYEPRAYAIFAHCFTCTKNLSAIRNISRSLTQAGIAVLRFDFTGLGDSEGDFADTNFSSNVSDLVSAAEYLEQNFEAPSLLIGHSLGGAAVIFAAGQISSIEAVATIGAPASPEHVSHLFAHNISEIENNDVSEVNIGGRPFTIKKQFLEDISSQNLTSTLRKLKKPLLIMHSPQDSIVGIENASELYSAAFHPKSFVSLNGADHLMSNKSDSMYGASRYLQIPEKEILQTDQQVVVRLGESGFTTTVSNGKHSFLADEPISVGGDDLGPTPYDLLLSSLGTCTVMTLRMYANRKKWDLQGVTIHLSHKKEYAKDCEDCESSKSKIDVITKSIELNGKLDDAQKNRMMEIADRCPVHRTIMSDMEIRSELKAQI